MMAISFKGAHFPQDIILMGVRWYVAYPLSYRQVEELLEERGVPVDHATIQRWVVKYSPLLEEALHRRKPSVWVSWRMDETYIKVKGQWYYLYRAVDKHGQTMDFLLTEHRDTAAVLRFLKKAIRRNGLPETITIDGSDANEAAIKSYNEAHGHKHGQSILYTSAEIIDCIPPGNVLVIGVAERCTRMLTTCCSYFLRLFRALPA
jgi:transposase-like protein